MKQFNKQGRRRDPWSEEELEWLRQNYNKGSKQWLASELNRSIKGVEQKLYKQRLSYSGRSLRIIVINPKIQVQVIPKRLEDFVCQMPVFGKVMLAIYPVAIKEKTSVWKKRRNIILKMHDYQCFWCGKDATSVDHIKPRHDGGIDHRDNLVAACHACNSAHVGRVKTWLDWTPKLLTPVNN